MTTARPALDSHAARIPPSAPSRAATATATQDELGRLRALCVHDLSTGAFNRRHLEMLAESEWTRALRHRRPLSILIFEPAAEVDGGEALPERTLARIAYNVQAMLRGGGDALGRYDQCRFAVLLPETDADGTRLMAERLRRAVSRPVSDSTIGPIRALIGAATLRETCAGEKGWRGAMELAENALARAHRLHDPMVLIEVAAPVTRWPVT
ncbi:MAG: Two-component response regulator [Panacagrimonas sp.]|jgi:diguanylate cyclase (GGDEF)-like protein|nr:diguanylate cyclase [Panacagrimonas sp.]MCC2658059.1 Two-component response regulator [Panacagrimonas sp.]